MKDRALFIAGLTVILAMGTVFIKQAAVNHEIAKVQESTAQFSSTIAARAAGYDLVPGLDYCFQSYGVGALGYRFINAELLDTTLDLLYPEALIFAPDVNGGIELGAVEYIVPAAAWDSEHDELPQILGQSFHPNRILNAYVLHVWIWKNNPAGMFDEWNPTVSCPAPIPWEGPGRWR